METGRKCPQCGAPLGLNVTECNFCGSKFAAPQTPPPVQAQYMVPATPPASPYAPPQQVVYVQQGYPGAELGISPYWPVKSKLVAGLLAIFLGNFGIHKFYLGRIGMGVLYLLFCWTWIPGTVGFIEGIIYFCTDDINFQVKHKCRILN